MADVESVLIKPKDNDGGKDEEKEYPCFMAYSHPAHMHNVDLSAKDELEFVELSHKRPGYASSSLDSGDLKVGREFSSKDGFFTALK
ncbi:hypothetical protein PVK06_021227 [Gossypium arboreum]|uniref:Uncharacterized protein n=1 Tax=Gossypium arboreum TaxID=29729 RepID=A0ABR0PPF0_GOSAR|nr:hypothetical protein PVK06_021227 [Gossypium arboreum]